MIYARAADYFGVELQKGGDLDKAGEYFHLAMDLDPESASALVNRDYNLSLRENNPNPLKRSDEVQKRLNRYKGNWDWYLGHQGPVDEPAFRNELAQVLAKGGNFRQAAQQLLRISSLTPTNIDVRVGVASMCMQAGLFDQALQSVADLRAKEKLHTVDKQALIQTEAWTYAAKNDLPAAEKVLREAQERYPLDDLPFATLGEIYLRMGRITNAMEVFEKELKAQPENSTALNNYARVKMLNKEFEAAIKLLDHAHSLDPKSLVILINRSISNLKVGRLEDAQRDYEALEKSMPKVPAAVYYGLFDIAYKKKNPKTAVKYAQLYLKDAVKGTPEYKEVLERMSKAKSGSI